MTLTPREDAPTATDAEEAMGALRDDFVRLQAERQELDWRLALHGLADEVEDVVVTLRRLAMHERVWRESMGTKPVEPPIFENPSHNSMQQMVRGRADLRSFIVLTDVLLDDATKALRLIGAPINATDNFFAFAKHLENGGAGWSKALLPLADDIVGLQCSLGYFRDKFVVHRGLLPVAGTYLVDGSVRLQQIAGTKSDAELERGGRELARVLPVPDTPLDPIYDFRLDVAFLALRGADPEKRRELSKILEEFGATSPDPYETAVEVAQVLRNLFSVAERELPVSD